MQIQLSSYSSNFFVMKEMAVIAIYFLLSCYIMTRNQDLLITTNLKINMNILLCVIEYS